MKVLYPINTTHFEFIPIPPQLKPMVHVIWVADAPQHIFE